jgi:ABC-2 type transport system permease protein
MFQVLLRKEILEARRTSRLLVTLVVFFVAGLISPILAKYTPLILSSIPGLPPGLANAIPSPTVQDAITQYVKNISQFGILLVILFGMASIAQEKERGTAAMLLTKPVRRRDVILVKWLAAVLTMLGGLAASATACLIYTAILFQWLPVKEYLILNGLMAIFLGVYLTVSIFASSLARSQSAAAAGAFGGLVILLVLSSIPRLSDFLPGQLLGWGSELMFGGGKAAWGALAVSLGLIIAMLILAVLHFEREEI